MRAAEATIAPEAATVDGRAPFGRRRDGQLIAGVAGGLADWLGLPAGGVRVAFFFLLPAVFGGAGTLGVYAAATLLMPIAGERRPGWSNLAALLRIGALILIFLSIPETRNLFLFASDGPISSWLPMNVLGLLALVLVFREARRPWQPERDRIVVLAAAPVFFAGGVLACGIWLVPDVEWQRFVPILPIAASGALLFAARSKAGSALLAPAVAAVAISGTIVASGAQLRGGIGDETIQPRTAAEVPERLQRAAGDLRIDLSKLKPSRELIVIRATVGAGEVHLTLPLATRLALDTKVGRGEIRDFAAEGNSSFGSKGFDLTMKDRGLTVDDDFHPGIRHRIKVVVNVGFGEIELATPDTF